ncbi:MAG: hypothetical protein O7D33_03720 [Chloroflexi bacterium]|nr:hypothetical protein [Chloroflexota bacterium]
MRHLTLPILALASLIVLACGGSGDAPYTPTPETTPTPAPTAVPTTPPPPKFRGYDLNLSAGTYWDYRWEYETRSCSRDGCTTRNDDGQFRVTLGGQQVISGVGLFELSVSGKSQVDGESRDFAPRWRYIGIEGDRIVVSDGSSLRTLFDARLGRWAGSGFFTNRFASDKLVEAVAGQIPESSNWPGTRAGPVAMVRRASSQSQCETIAGIRICGEESFNISEVESYRAGIGPVAYNFGSTASFSGGGFSSSHQTTETLALVSSSLRDNNRGLSEADLPPADITEFEPNDSRDQAQVLPRDQELRGHVASGDAGGDPFTLAVNNRRVLVRVHDYYIFDLAEESFVDIALLLTGAAETDATVGLILWNDETDERLGTSFEQGALHQEVDGTFPAGVYLVGVSGLQTPDEGVTYNLRWEAGKEDT